MPPLPRNGKITVKWKKKDLISKLSGFLDLTGPEDYNQLLRKWKAHWWGSRTSNPVCRLRGRQVGSIPMHFRHQIK